MGTTISDVAKHAGVSKSTVSNYLNGKFEKMSAETKTAIERTIKEMGYTPNLSARRLPNKEKSKTICLIIPGSLTRLFDSFYYPTIFSAMDRISGKMKYNMLIYSRKEPGNINEMNFLKGMAESIVDGYIIFDLSADDLFFKEFEEAGIPYVCCGKIEDYEDYRYVASDHKKAMADTLDHLFQLGHRKIGIFRQNDSSVVEQTRKRGVKEICEKYAVEESNIRYIEVPTEATDQKIYEIWIEHLKQEDRPTAYIISTTIRQQFQLAAQTLGLSIPKDISYVNIEYYIKKGSEEENQTKVVSKAGMIAELAFKKLLKIIYNPTSEFESQMVPLELTVGETTAALKNHMEEKT